MSKFKHKKRGTTYTQICVAKVQTDVPLNDYDKVVVYQSDLNGSYWVRPFKEFEDRFEPLTE